MNWIMNNLQLLIVLAFILLPAIRGIGVWLQQQAAKNKAEAERRRRADEALRTGRASVEAPSAPPERAMAPSPDTDDREEESFAARRRRQLEELRRREELARQRREAAARQRGTPSRAERAPAPPSAVAAPPVTAVPVAETAIGDVIGLATGARHGLRAARPGAAPAAAAGLAIGRVPTRDELRRAIVLSEVLAPPLALRDTAVHAPSAAR